MENPIVLGEVPPSRRLDHGSNDEVRSVFGRPVEVLHRLLKGLEEHGTRERRVDVEVLLDPEKVGLES